MSNTVAALSSGLVPSGVAVIRVSGPAVRFALETLCGIPKPRMASFRRLKSPDDGRVLDEALVLFFPEPNSFTGEDVAEFHCHGGRAVVEAVLDTLWSMDGIEPAEAGDFTRQAFLNNKLDLTQVEAVGDLIHATTEDQRALAVDQLGGRGKDTVRRWKEAIASIRVTIEADLDFSDEDDVPGSIIDSLPEQIASTIDEIRTDLSDTFSERLRDGFRVVLAGPPNSGKSTLLNALVDRQAALVSQEAGTTRDRIDVAVDMDGLPVIITDTAGLRSSAVAGDIEQMGMVLTKEAIGDADCVVWLHADDEVGTDMDMPLGSIRVRSKCDLDQSEAQSGVMAVSGISGAGLADLKAAIAQRLRQSHDVGSSIRGTAVVALDSRRRNALLEACQYLESSILLLEQGTSRLDQAAEELRLAQRSLGTIVGDVDPEGLLDRLFSSFCIGK